jgi:hypothetical protein
MVFAAIVGIANYSIYMATIDYMICAYGPYSASATGSNGWSRDFLASVLTILATPFFESKSVSIIRMIPTNTPQTSAPTPSPTPPPSSGFAARSLMFCLITGMKENQR